MFGLGRKKSVTAHQLAQLAQRVDTIESNAARDSHDSKAEAQTDLASIRDQLERIDDKLESGFKLLAESLLVNMQRLEKRQDDFERITNLRLTALEAQKEIP